MIQSFRHKGLEQLFLTGKTAKINAAYHRRILVRLDALDAAQVPQDLNLPGFNFHSLAGFDPTRYTVHVNGSWCITFVFEGTDAIQIDFEQYH